MFVLITLVFMLVKGDRDRILTALATVFLVLLPDITEKMFDCRISLPVYIFACLYALGPMMGKCLNFYYTVYGWDKLLHISGGVMFAFFGVFLFERLAGRRRETMVIAAIFGLCFSIAVSAVWEFFEFGHDVLLGGDMQMDTVIHEMHSYMLSDMVGESGELKEIKNVTVNGKPLPVDGYIDIGLIDTMKDMILESVGALAVAVIYIMKKGRLQIFSDREKGECGAVC